MSYALLEVAASTFADIKGRIEKAYASTPFPSDAMRYVQKSRDGEVLVFHGPTAIGLVASKEPTPVLTEAQIKHMTNRFLGWSLPEDFNPDGGVIYDKSVGHRPVGTNVLTATQAEAMVRYMVEGMSIADNVSNGEN